MRALALLPLMALAACATKPAPEPVVRTVTVDRAIVVACVPRTLGPAPQYPDTDANIRASAGPGDLLQLLAAGRLLRQQRLAELEPVITACRRHDPG